MDYLYTAFDEPQWRWVLQEAQTRYGIIDTECVISVVDPRRTADASAGIAVVQLTPPMELVKFVFDRFKGAKSAKVYIDIYGTRAYAILSVDEKETPLWYWTRSTAPNWLQEFLGERRKSGTRSAVQ